MDVKHLNYTELYLRLQWAIGSMEVMLSDAKIKAPDRDYSESEKRIGILNEFKESYLEVIEENRIVHNMNFKVTKQFHIMDDKIKKLEAQIKANNF